MDGEGGGGREISRFLCMRFGEGGGARRSRIKKKFVNVCWLLSACPGVWLFEWLADVTRSSSVGALDRFVSWFVD